MTGDGNGDAQKKDGQKGQDGAGKTDPRVPAVPGSPPPADAGPHPSPDMGGDVLEVSDLTWEKAVEKAAVPVAVMFYSPSCAFCHQMEPYFRAYAKEFLGVVAFARINILQNQWTAERYAVRSTPTFRFFCGGKPVQELVGAVYPAILKRAVSEVLVHGEECAKSRTEIDYEITGYG